MSSNILKEKIPLNILTELMDAFCFVKNEKYYIIDLDTYKKIILEKKMEDFLEKIRPYYKKAKLYYINRPIKYVYFLTLVRHICNSNNIIYTSSIYYNKSKHYIKYLIYKKTISMESTEINN